MPDQEITAAVAWPGLEAAGDLEVYKVVTAGVSWPGLSASFEEDIEDEDTGTFLDNLNVHVAFADTSWTIESPVAQLTKAGTRIINAPVSWQLEAAADLLRFDTTMITANVSWPALSSRPTQLALYLDEDRPLPLRVDTQDPALLGAEFFCHAPDSLFAVAATRARRLCLVNTRDPHTLQVDGSISLKGEPVAMASRVFRRAVGQQYVFVALARTEEFDSTALLQVWDLANANAPVLLAEKSYDRPIHALWAPDNAGTSSLWRRAETDFIVVSGDDGIELLSADPELRLLASARVGLYRPFVAEVVARADLAPELSASAIDKEVWDLVMFSERTAFGSALRITRTTSATETNEGVYEEVQYRLEPLMPFPAEHVEGPFGTRWLVDHLHGITEVLIPLRINEGQYTIADDEPPGFDREWAGDTEFEKNLFNLDGTPLPSGNPRVMPDLFEDWRVVDVPREEFTGLFSITMRDNRNGIRFARLTFQFIRPDGTILDSVDLWGRYFVGQNYRQQGPPYDRQAWSTNPQYGEVLYEGHAFNNNFGDGMNVFAVVKPPGGVQTVRVINWCYAYPRNQADFDAGLIENSWPYEFEVQTRPRIWVSMIERRLSVPVERYDQAQRWGVTLNAPVPRRRAKFRKEHILGADWSYELTDLVPSLDRQPFDDVTAEGPLRPRNAVARVRGGFLHIHGKVGRLSKHHLFPDEFTQATFQV